MFIQPVGQVGHGGLGRQVIVRHIGHHHEGVAVRRHGEVFRGKRARVGIVFADDGGTLAPEEEDVQVADGLFAYQSHDEGALAVAEGVFIVMRVLVAGREGDGGQGTHYYI